MPVDGVHGNDQESVGARRQASVMAGGGFPSQRIPNRWLASLAPGHEAADVSKRTGLLHVARKPLVLVTPSPASPLSVSVSSSSLARLLSALLCPRSLVPRPFSHRIPWPLPSALPSSEPPPSPPPPPSSSSSFPSSPSLSTATQSGARGGPSWAPSRGAGYVTYSRGGSGGEGVSGAGTEAGAREERVLRV